MNWRIIPILCLASFTSTMGQGLVVPLLPGYAKSLGATGFLIGLIFGMFSISRIIFLPYFGKLSDVKGRKPFIVWGLFFYFCASLAFILSHNVTSLIVIRFFQGISSAMILPVAQAYAAELSVSGQEGRVMGYINISIFSGLSAGPFFGGFIKDSLGIVASFFGMGFVCILGCALSFALLPSSKEEKTRITREVPVSAAKLIYNSNMVGVMLIRFGYMICMGTLWAFLPLIAETEYQMSSSLVGFILTLVILSNAILSIPVGILSDISSKRLIIVLGGILSIFGTLLLYGSTEKWELYIVAGLMGIGGGFVTPASTAMSAVMGKNQNSVGSVMSILNMAQSFGMFVGPITAGIILDVINIKTAFLSNGIIFIILLIVATYLTRNYYLLENKD